ncbi:MAG TPA: DUF3710 domain-containing protein [Streptosporangiaceae bacterium]|nr:DUF3710 domain-containing protein [Streptosporangiaceae bacterium]
MLRRRRREGDDHTQIAEPYARADEVDVDGNGLPGASYGPWDIADNFPATERVDCGSLLIPLRDGFDVQINVAEEQDAWVAVVHEHSGMQLQAFAAPRTGGLWKEVRHEIVENVAESGGRCQEADGQFGVELIAQVPISAEGETPEIQPVRFLGFDGPRWFLRGVISGPGASDKTLNETFDALFADVVVVRGDYPAPPREQLEIRLPEEARQAIEEHMETDQPDWILPDPFTRGPEITETR